MSIQISDQNIKVSSFNFAGGEVHVQLENLAELAPEQIDIRADIHSSDDLMRLLLVHNSLQHHYGNDVKINLEIPYFPYARQDRVCSRGQAFSLQVVAKILMDLNVNSITVWDAHSPVTQALTGAINILQQQIIAKNEKLISYLQSNDAVLVCPDKGARMKCQEVKDFFSVKQMVYSEKRRDAATGNIINTQLLADDLSGKTAIIIDDICDGGRTFVEIAKQLKAINAEHIILYVTHGIFSKGLEVFDGLIDEIYTSNSFPQEQNDKLSVIAFSKFSTTNKRSAKI